MTNPMINPNYSGVTIQISNPAVYADGSNARGIANTANISNPDRASYINRYANTYDEITNSNLRNHQYSQEYLEAPNNIDPRYNAAYNTGYVTNPNLPQQAANSLPPQQNAYPPQYYLNNYNYQNNNPNDMENAKKILAELQEQNMNNAEKAKNSEAENVATETSANNHDTNSAIDNNTNSNQPQEADYQNTNSSNKPVKQYEPNIEEPQDFTKSQAVIDDLDARAAAEAAEKKNSKQKRVVALTDEYIKSLENYLNNPNDEIRLMASKEILTRLDEDKDRYNDAALNALLNKMLQDPSKLIRVAALSAFASQLASGNDYTVQLLHNIQQNPNADKEDILQAADILLKMSAGTEVKNIPNPAAKETPKENENKGPLQQ